MQHEREIMPGGQQPRQQLARHHPEYLLRLFCCQKGSGIKEPRRMRQCCVESADWICRLAHRSTAMVTARPSTQDPTK